MKIGYPCINYSIDCTPNKTFRLRNYSEERLVETVSKNLHCLYQILQYNSERSILFFRISSDIIPFASHEVCSFDWVTHFSDQFKRIGVFIRDHQMRISMHPDQFTLINAKDERIVQRSYEELRYHAAVLDAMELDTDAKIQIHVGGVYGDKEASMQRFVNNFAKLDEAVRRRLVIENDDVSYTLDDCLRLNEMCDGIPILYDEFHNQIKPSGYDTHDALECVASTWRTTDGIPMIDYSLQQPNEKPGKHADSIKKDEFYTFLERSKPFDFDIMLEIRDKENSALAAIDAAFGDERFIHTGATR